MESYEYIICGAGIAGLYSALNLIEKNNIDPKKILIIEKSYRVGGLIQTNKNDELNIKYENGAGRFTENDEIFKSLIARFALQDKIINKDSHIIAIINGHLLLYSCGVNNFNTCLGS